MIHNWRSRKLWLIFLIFLSCVALCDLTGDGDTKLVVADLGTGNYNMKLRVYKGTQMISENTIIDLPTGVVTIHMDQTEPRIPAIAVASGTQIYNYKNLKPYVFQVSTSIFWSSSSWKGAMGTFIKDVRFFLWFLEIPTYLCPIHYVLSFMYYVRISLTYLPTQKSDILYERSLMATLRGTNHFWRSIQLLKLIWECQ